MRSPGFPFLAEAGVLFALLVLVVFAEGSFGVAFVATAPGDRALRTGADCERFRAADVASLRSCDEARWLVCGLLTRFWKI